MIYASYPMLLRLVIPIAGAYVMEIIFQVMCGNRGIELIDGDVIQSLASLIIVADQCSMNNGRNNIYQLSPSIAYRDQTLS